MQIVLNGEKINVAPEDRITYEAIVGLAGYPGSREIVVRFDFPDGDRGSLRPGQSVEIVSGMTFRATHTGGA